MRQITSSTLSRNMLPPAARNYMVHGTGGNTMPSGDFALGQTPGDKASNVNHIGLGEFGAARALPGMHPALSRCIKRVVLGCAQRQVGGIHTPGIITRVENIEGPGRRAVLQLIRNAVGKFVTVADTNRAVSILKTGLPLPTLVGSASLHLLPESVSQWTAAIMAMNEPTAWGRRAFTSALAQPAHFDRIGVKHWKPLSGGPEGVLSTWPASFYTANYSKRGVA